MSFVKNLTKLTMGTAISQLIYFSLMPVLTRFYLPQAFGELSVFTSLITIVSAVITLRYELVIVLPKRDEDASNILGICLTSVGVISLVSFLVLVIFEHQLFSLFGVSVSHSFKYFVLPMLLFNGIFITFNNWSIRKKYFGLIAKRNALQSFVNQLSALGFAIAGSIQGVYLILATLLGRVVATSSLVNDVLKKDGQKIRQNISRDAMREMARRYSSFPRYNIWSNLLNVVSQNSPALGFAYFFGISAAGYYALCRQVLSVPMVFIGNSISQVFLQKASEVKNESPESFAHLVESMCSYLLLLSAYPFLVITFFGDRLFQFIFGAQWVQAGVYAQLISLSVLVGFISSILTMSLTVLELQKEALFQISFFFVLRIFALSVGFFVHNPLIAVGVYASVELFCRSFQIFRILYLSGACFGLILKKTPKLFLISLCTLMFAFLPYIRAYFTHTPVLVAYLIAGAGVYYATAIFSDNFLRQNVKLCLKGMKKSKF